MYLGAIIEKGARAGAGVGGGERGQNAQRTTTVQPFSPRQRRSMKFKFQFDRKCGEQTLVSKRAWRSCSEPFVGSCAKSARLPESL